MSDLFTTAEGAWGDGSVRLTVVGMAVTAAVILALVVAAALLRQRKEKNRARITTKQLVFSAAAMALSLVCSLVKFADLPMGGSVTLFSMLFIVLIGYWYGPYVGIMAGFAYGLLQFVLAPIFYTIPQMLFDYPLPFAALGLAGFFSQKKWGLQIGYVVGVIGRYICHVISGYVFFYMYAPEGMHPLVYSLGYNATYIVPEAVLTLILISIPSVARALEFVKRQAVSVGAERVSVRSGSRG